ncbi:MAG: DNA polymerase I [Methylococcales bacterium]|nr:DNA polymerase I [Methylococcales bacterium]MBT7411251.1 DNA polymerase I [Methylococcales bacterium]
MGDKKQNLLVLVDGSSYLFRAFHGMPPLINSKSMPTGAIYGVINMLKSLMERYPTSYFCVVFDAKGKTFRHDFYPDYKANRPPMDNDLRIQIEPLHQIIKAMGLPLLIVPNVEADDVIGTLSVEATKAGFDTLVSTGDKDLAQLVNQSVTLIDTMKNFISDEAGVIDKFGIKPDQIIDYLTLVGDTSDNIPGVNKVGPKTAVKWLTKYGSLDKIIQHADEIKGKVGEYLRDSFEQIPISKQLATIVCDLSLDVAPNELKMTEADNKQLSSLFAEYEFKSWLAKLPADEQSTTEEPIIEKEATHYDTILTQESLDQWITKLNQTDLFAFDTETTSINYMKADLVGMSFSVKAGEAAYLPLAHDYPGVPEQLDKTSVLQQIKPLLEDRNKKKVGQHLKYDRNVLNKCDIELNGIQHDTMMQSYIYDSTATKHDMDSLALKYLNIHTVHFEDIAGKGKKQITFNQVELEKASNYAAEDADITFRLHQHLWPKLSDTPPIKSVYQDIEIPLIPVLSRIELNGVMIDADLLKQQSHEISQRLFEIEEKSYDIAGEKFNLNSPKQIQHIFFEKLGLPILKKTPKKQPSTAENVLQELALDYPLPKLILEHRGLSKLKSTYTDKLPEQIDAHSQRIHTSYHQAVAATGRLSSNSPNLQNIPIRSEEGRKIRQAFIAPDGYKIMAADYSQIELRIMAHLSKDEGLISAFSNGLDVHQSTAAEVFNIALEDVSSLQRRSAKAINFGLIYGMSAFGLANQLGIKRQEAQNYIDLYFSRYPGVMSFMETTKEFAREQGYVETIFGRRLYLPDIKSKNGQRRQYAERSAINAPMQGTAADIIKKAMIDVDQWILQDKPDVKMIMQVHDELVFEVNIEQIEEVKNKTTEMMQQCAEIDVPLIVEVGVGDNWGEAH